MPALERPESLTMYLDRIRELHLKCEGNFTRVHEELIKDWKREGKDIEVGYSTLTGFCRRQEIGVRRKSSGEYHFEPGVEMQHDTSPHTVKVGDEKRKLQCASLVLCYSRMIYMQVYEVFQRFTAKVFLNDAIKFFGGAAEQCMTDNTNVVVASGTGKKAKMAPEMEAFANHYGFIFVAHELGDANRSARVERPFRFIENNFYPGRTFKDLKDLNVQAIAWCDRSNQKHRRRLKASPLELFQKERAFLRPLPNYIPEPYRIAHRSVDLSGYVSLHANRYSVSDDYIGRDVRVRETKDQVQILYGHQLVAVHSRLEHGVGKKSRIDGHRRKDHWKKKRREGSTAKEERVLASAGPELVEYLKGMKQNCGRLSRSHILKLYKLFIDYPTDALVQAVQVALKYGQFNINSLETIVIKNIAGNYFKLDLPQNDKEIIHD